VVKNTPIFESNFVFATLMPLASNQLITSQQSDGSAQCSSQVMKGNAFKNCDMALTQNKRKSSPTRARERTIDSSMAGTLFLNFSNYYPLDPVILLLHAISIL
jgi:hypothetical protein